jgi:hypothetical protein
VSDEAKDRPASVYLSVTSTYQKADGTPGENNAFIPLNFDNLATIRNVIDTILEEHGEHPEARTKAEDGSEPVQRSGTCHFRAKRKYTQPRLDID